MQTCKNNDSVFETFYKDAVFTNRMFTKHGLVASEAAVALAQSPYPEIFSVFLFGIAFDSFQWTQRGNLL